MKIKRKYLFFFMLALPLFSYSQKVSNIHFEQVSKQIHIYYDLQGDQEYIVQVFCSTDDGKSWGNQLQNVTGEVGENQKQGNNKKIIWDVLAEREKLSGNIQFKLKVSTGNKGTFTDKRDGQTYNWVKIGKQVWMAENLNYKTENSCCYDYKEISCNKYGSLYNWNAARTVCPASWHLPTNNEWKTLEMYLGMSQSEADNIYFGGTDEGKKLKSTSGWNSGGNGTNEVGFSALPGGYRYKDGGFYDLGSDGVWWSATEYSSTRAWYRTLNYSNHKIRRYNKSYGFSVRCLQD